MCVKLSSMNTGEGDKFKAAKLIMSAAIMCQTTNKH